MGGSDWLLGKGSLLGLWSGTETESSHGPKPVGAQEAFGKCSQIHSLSLQLLSVRGITGGISCTHLFARILLMPLSNSSTQVKDDTEL